MDDLNHSGFVVSKHHVRFETLDSQIAEAIMTDVMRKIRLWDGKNHTKSQCPMLTDRQLVYQIFRSSAFFETQGYTMSMNDLLHMELHSDNLKMFNQTWEETRRI